MLGSSGDRAIVCSGGRIIGTAEFLRDAAALAQRLPPGRYLVNLCERRDTFLSAYFAALIRGQTNLLPASRASDVIEEVLAAYGGSYRCDDDMAHALAAQSAATVAAPSVAAEHIAEIAFTSGSTGRPQAHAKRWGGLLRSSQMHARRIRECLRARYADAQPWIVATVPPQHMYGTETSVLLPLVADMAVHAGRPLFPADVAAALEEVPEPRVLVTTPVHLRALLAAGQAMPPVGVVLSATAPLEPGLAASVEQALNTVVLEIFGSTETCGIATRFTAREEAWRAYAGVELEPQAECTLVRAPWLDAQATLQDLIELRPDGRFIVRGRSEDMIEVAGKRASLADLTRRLLSVTGVTDAVVFQPSVAPRDAAVAVRRLAALVVAPGLTAQQITAQLSHSVDPAFIPRPLVLLPALPRNENGKLTRDSLMAALPRGRTGT